MLCAIEQEGRILCRRGDSVDAQQIHCFAGAAVFGGYNRKQMVLTFAESGLFGFDLQCLAGAALIVEQIRLQSNIGVVNQLSQLI